MYKEIMDDYIMCCELYNYLIDLYIFIKFNKMVVVYMKVINLF